jgi:TolB-like protein
MVSPVGASADHPRPTVFLSYASEDRAAARRIGAALPSYGMEVWYDESELGGGDAWDQKIRKQIRDCDYFMAIVSAQTEARSEGYFRREWRLAVERTLDMADDHTFLLPVVIDETSQAGARVPEKFLAVQWVKAPGGEPTPALQAVCRRLASGDDAVPETRERPAPRRPAASTVQAGKFPDFPREESGQRTRFWFAVIGWSLRCAWLYFRRLPRWLRVAAYVWIGVVFLSKGCTPSHHQSAGLSAADARKLKTISEQYKDSSNAADAAKLGAQIAREFAKDDNENSARNALLAIPFAAPPGDPPADKLANATFAQVYGRLSITRPGRVGLAKEALVSCDTGPALESARARHAVYVLCGSVVEQGTTPSLTIKIIAVEDGEASLVWSKSYPANTADPEKIATEVESKMPSLDDD